MQLPAGVIQKDTDTSITCPTGVGFDPTDTCFSVTFDESYFTPGHWHFIGVFTQNGNVVNIVGNDYRVHSFFVLPEAAIGAVAVLASIFGAFIAYSMRRR